MSANREAIATALLAVLTGAYAWNNTPSRRLKLWNEVPNAQKPALFLDQARPEAFAWGAQPTPRRTFTFCAHVYIDTHNPTAIGDQQLNAIMLAIEAALAPLPGFLKQTLGGVCDNCRISKVPLRDPGSLDGDGWLIVEIEVIGP